MNLKIAVIGNGGREHALCWKLNQSPSVSHIYVIPGNGGTELNENVTNVKLNMNEVETVVDWCKQHQVNLVVVGPEVPLSAGIANILSKNEIPCFGPTLEAARIESDKQWSKFFMDKYGIPTARWKSFVDAADAKGFIRSVSFPATVIKASGLASGKGVIVANSTEEACEAIDEILVANKFGKAGHVVVVEEYLEGEEVSVLAFSDGKIVREMLPVQDHKRLLNFDEGPNTGGMGAFCPYVLTQKDMAFIRESILQKTVCGLSNENSPFVGVLYAGLMITTDGIKVLEFNCRFGDPETQVLMPLLESDLVDIFLACCNGKLKDCEVKWKQNSTCVAVVMASEEYPDDSLTSNPINGLACIENISNAQVFHAATKLQGNEVLTNGGRVLNVVVVDEDLIEAATKATKICAKIKFKGCQYRTDIAHKGIPRYILTRGGGTYQSAGVDISSGNDLIRKIKPLVEATFRDGILSPLGSFAAVIDAKLEEFSHPLLVSGCDGVGTKLKIAQQCNKHRTIGQDLVAMCVNDILAHGGRPLFFLDYFACGKLQSSVAEEVIMGITEGCRIADCALVGGETAEMPGLYSEGEYDLAGFVVGIVDKPKLLPKSDLYDGDKVIYLPSNGVHSNGFSLIRKIMRDLDLSYNKKAPFGTLTYGEEFLTPTKIYVSEMLPLIEKGAIKAYAHITGGGLLENIIRVVPPNLKIDLDASLWSIPSVFPWIAAVGGICDQEMLRTFNCGIGAVVIASPEHVEDLCASLKSNVIGTVGSRKSDECKINVRNFSRSFGKLMTPYVSSIVSLRVNKARKRVAVLISGTGTNLQALIEETQNVKSEANIVLVISSKKNVKGLQIAEKYGITSLVIERYKSLSGESNDCSIQEELVKNNIDLVCLAGYMHLLSEWFVNQWRGKMLNIHPSLLPSFKGMHGPKQALEAGVRITGCTVHFVEFEMDSGAIIEQAAVAVYPQDTVDSLAKRIQQEEHFIFPKALKLVAAEKIRLDLRSGKIIYN